MAVRARRPSLPATPSPESANRSGRVAIPKTVTDPVASLQPWSVTVFFAGSMYEIPAMPAADWLQVLLDPAGDVFDLFPGLCPEEEQDAINEALFEGAASLDDLGEAALQTVSAAAGRPWWVAVRLVAVAHSSWHTLGAEMLFRGVDATRLSLSGWLDVLLLTIMRNIEDDKATMFVMKLEAPLEGTDAEQKEPEMSATDFMSMA